LHWRRPSRAVWVPLLDTRQLARLASGKKRESYFPIAVADNKFHCIILKGGDQYPYFPRPLLSEFEFAVPLGGPKKKKKSKSKKPKKKKQRDMDDDLDMDAVEEEEESSSEEVSDEETEEGAESKENRALHQAYLLKGLLASQLADLLEEDSDLLGRTVAAQQRATLARLELDIDKTLLQMLAVECREGEHRGPRALEAVKLMRDRSGKMVEAAGKVAERYDRRLLGEKIREEGERRLLGGATGGNGGGRDVFDDDDDDFP